MGALNMGGTGPVASSEFAADRRTAKRRGLIPAGSRRCRWTALLFAFAICFAIGLGSAPAKADAFYDGLVAYNSRNYAGAARIWQRLAEHGHANAQSSLGFLYAKGLGVPANSAKAAHWFLRAATKGVVEAQMFLGVMHLNGDGVPKSAVLAYMWSDVAVAAGYAQAIDFRAAVARELTPKQIDEAQRLSLNWRQLQAANLGQAGRN
jgi:TPR repeat protein